MKSGHPYLSTVVSISGDLVLNPNTAQGKAFAWLKEVDGPNETFLSDSEMVERYVIALLYFSLNGQNWLQNDGFLSHLHVCNWFGVTCSNELVVKLEWSSNNLNGIYSSGIPKEISQLVKLNFLDLHSSNLDGPLPESIGSMKSLREFSYIPDTFADLHNLDESTQYKSARYD